MVVPAVKGSRHIPQVNLPVCWMWKVFCGPTGTVENSHSGDDSNFLGDPLQTEGYK
jgi:hypothetical protein